MLKGCGIMMGLSYHPYRRFFLKCAQVFVYISLQFSKMGMTNLPKSWAHYNTPPNFEDDRRDNDLLPGLMTNQEKNPGQKKRWNFSMADGIFFAGGKINIISYC